MIWRRGDAAERYAERRRREEEAPRLLTAIPTLESLRLEIEERRAGGSLSEAAHVRRIVVERAPALFVLPCHDAACKGGGHDVTPDHDAPQTSKDEDGDPSQATGNPGAAGG